MSAGTAGAVFDAIARMRRAERELARPRRIGHARLLRKRDGGGGVPDRLPFPCFFLCDSCGRLEEGSSADPMRRDGEDGSVPGPCPACHAKAWIDLRCQSTALAYLEAEAMGARQSDEQGYHRRLWIGAATSTAVTSALVLWEPALIGLGGMVMIVFIVAWLATSLVVAALERHARPARARPRRWRHPLPLPHDPRRGLVHGAITGDAALRAPLSQEPCLGWSVQVWSDDVQLLDEQCHVALAVGGEAFEPDSVRLELESRELRPRDGDEAFARFLQRRGLSPHDPSLRVREACLRPGATVEVKPRDAREGGLVLSPGPRALAA